MAATPSTEQLSIIDHVMAGRSVCVRAMAGSGKTSTSILAARARHAHVAGSRTLILTYNERLKTETREKIACDSYIEAHSFHAAALRYFTPPVKSFDDALLHEAIRGRPTRPLGFDLIVIDECQDMSSLLYIFVRHVLRHVIQTTGQPPIVVLVGDPFQRIFGFRGADLKYLMHPDAEFGDLVSGGRFERCNLTISWRITHEMAEWINEHLDPRQLARVAPADVWRQYGPFIHECWGSGIRANPARDRAPGSVVMLDDDAANMSYDGAQRLWYFTNAFTIAEYVRRESLRFGPSNTVVLGYSMKSNNAARAVVNTLTDVNWIVLNGEGDTGVNQDLLSNKQVASTIHKFKGLERDASFLMMFGPYNEARFDTCLDHYNLMYVGATRARHQLVLIPAPDGAYATMRYEAQVINPIRTIPKSLNVSELNDYVIFDPDLDYDGPDSAVGYQPAVLHPACVSIEAPAAIVMGSRATHEDVSAINGTIVGMQLEYQWTRQCRFATLAISCARNRYSQEFAPIIEHLTLPLDVLMDGWAATARTAVAATCLRTGLTHYWRQLDNVTEWIDSRALEICLHNAQAQLQSLLTVPPDATPDSFQSRLKFEYALTYPITEERYGCDSQLRGYADIVIDDTIVVELKCTARPDAITHALQVGAYWAIHHVTSLPTGPKWKPYVLHAPSGKLFAIDMRWTPQQLLDRLVCRKLNIPYI